jgi:hypothetical protein
MQTMAVSRWGGKIYINAGYPALLKSERFIAATKQHASDAAKFHS